LGALPFGGPLRIKPTKRKEIALGNLKVQNNLWFKGLKRPLKWKWGNNFKLSLKLTLVSPISFNPSFAPKTKGPLNPERIGKRIARI